MFWTYYDILCDCPVVFWNPKDQDRFEVRRLVTLWFLSLLSVLLLNFMKVECSLV